MIHFVGAGPGAPDLITLRGAKLLGEAGMIIYAGSLVNPELLKLAPSGCEIYNSASMTLDEVIEKLKSAHDRGMDAVRLHTGDPSIYGAIREQMDRLKELGIPYDVTPGVSSFCAAAAAAGAEYTLPSVSQTVIITRMEGRTPVPPREKLSSLASHQASMALFLSSGLMESTCAALLEGGYPPDTPAAVVYKASWPEQKVLRGTIATIAAQAEAENIHNTALILIGRFLGNDYELSKLYDASFSHGFRAASK
ncbi:MAG: precorrin-4 C(11)-methyltransferase [Pyramidobacter sp.]|nr:precorrin-4 C(11)-methyltransferase [Pyramidobacter sp.]MBP3751055.1 precorrin-4 C(11)-methyltransferase [Pyramidobacter sp.]